MPNVIFYDDDVNNNWTSSIKDKVEFVLIKRTVLNDSLLKEHPFINFSMLFKVGYHPYGGITTDQINDLIYRIKNPNNELDGIPIKSIVFDWDETLSPLSGTIFFSLTNKDIQFFELTGIRYANFSLIDLIISIGKKSDDMKDLSKLYFYNGDDKRHESFQLLFNECTNKNINVYIITNNYIPVNGAKFLTDVFNQAFNYILPTKNIFKGGPIGQGSMRTKKDIIKNKIISIYT